MIHNHFDLFSSGCQFGICFGAKLKADRDAKFVATLMVIVLTQHQGVSFDWL